MPTLLIFVFRSASEIPSDRRTIVSRFAGTANPPREIVAPRSILADPPMPPREPNAQAIGKAGILAARPYRFHFRLVFLEAKPRRGEQLVPQNIFLQRCEFLL